jgi:methyltransferase (TIGR00027 family)
MPIENVSDTARWVAVYRAMETKRPDAIFRDPFAERLAGERGQEIVDSMKRGRASAWAMIVRTAVFDEIILNAVKNSGVDLVLNLAAGLDARPWRLPLPSSLRWVDVDLPGILDYKVNTLASEKPACQYDAVRLDLRDGPKRRALFSQISGEAKNVFVVTEGLLIYLTAEHVSDLARDLHAEPNLRWWLFDLASPHLLKILERSWGKTLKEGNAPFLFGPAEGTKFFEPFGWREKEYRPSMDEAQRLNREMPMMWLWRTIAKLASAKKRAENAVLWRKMSGNVVLERA